MAPEEIAARCSVSAITFCDYLHANFVKFLQEDDLAAVERTLSALSDADILGHFAFLKYGDSSLEIQPEDMAVSVACRGYLTSLEDALPRPPERYTQIRAPQNDRVKRIAFQREQTYSRVFESVECRYLSRLLG